MINQMNGKSLPKQVNWYLNNSSFINKFHSLHILSELLKKKCFLEKNNDVIELRSSPFPDDTQALPTIRPQIPIAKPNFPRVAVPFVIAMWVFGTCIMKLSNHIN